MQVAASPVVLGLGSNGRINERDAQMALPVILQQRQDAVDDGKGEVSTGYALCRCCALPLVRILEGNLEGTSRSLLFTFALGAGPVDGDVFEGSGYGRGR